MKKIYSIALLLFVFQISTAQNIDNFVSLLANINPGDENGTPSNFIEYNGEIVFRANDGVNGIELWKLDSSMMPTLISDVRPGPDNSSPNFFIEFNNKLYFTAFDDNVGGLDLFSYDGTSVSSESLYGSSFSGLINPIELNGKLYYTGFNASFQSNKLIEFDGTTGGEVVDNDSGEANVLGGNTIAYNGKILLYMNYSTDDAAVGTELYEYDPAAQTFSLIKDIDQGSGNSSISNFVQLGNEVYFEAESQVWKTDGTNAGTVLITAVDNLGVGNVRNFFVWNDELYFEGDNGTDGDELWKYNPSTDTAVQLSNITGSNDNHDPSDFVIVDSPLLPAEILAYSAEPGTDSDSRLFSTDGSVVSQLTEEYVEVQEIFYWASQELVLFQGEEIDANGDDIFGKELYVYDLNSLSVENQDMNEVSIYPNPVENVIFIESNLSISDYSIFDLQGRAVQSGNLESNEIKTNLSSGVYVLNLNSGDKVSQHKIIIK